MGWGTGNGGAHAGWGGVLGVKWNSYYGGKAGRGGGGEGWSDWGGKGDGGVAEGYGEC